MTFLLIVHTLVCILLVCVVLMQSGRGGGLTESFAAAENMFGTRTNEFLVRITAILAVVFLISSLSLAHMSARRDQSLMERLMDKTKEPDIKINIPMDAPESSQAPADPAENSPQEPVADAAAAPTAESPAAETK